MLILKLLQSLVKALHSEGTPGQVAAGIALGSTLGLTPLLSLHNLLIVALIFLLNVSLPGAALGWALATPLGFALDPAFDALGRWLLLDIPALTPLWTALANTPVVPLTNFNNSVVLGSFVSALVLFPPVYLGSRWGVRRYRETLGERVRQSGLYRALTASKLYNLYRLFRPNV
ncbi:MAG TPA: TIGR03546 family protein [Gemmatimonadales bacterium]